MGLYQLAPSTMSCTPSSLLPLASLHTAKKWLQEGSHCEYSCMCKGSLPEDVCMVLRGDVYFLCVPPLREVWRIEIWEWASSMVALHLWNAFLKETGLAPSFSAFRYQVKTFLLFVMLVSYVGMILFFAVHILVGWGRICHFYSMVGWALWGTLFIDFLPLVILFFICF